MTDQTETPAVPLTRYIVVAANPDAEECGPYKSADYAAARCLIYNADYPTLGPWRVVTLAEVVP